MPLRLLASLFAFAAFALGACTGGSPTDQNLNTDAGADYGLHPREVHPDTAAAGAGGQGGVDGAAGEGAGGSVGVAGQGAGGAGGTGGQGPVDAG